MNTENREQLLAALTDPTLTADIFEQLRRKLTEPLEGVDPYPVNLTLNTAGSPFKNHHNSVPSQGELPFGESETVPDQSMSVREIMDRFARGLPLEGERVPLWEGEEDESPDFENMDLAEREEYMNNMRQELADLKAKLENQKDEPEVYSDDQSDEDAAPQQYPKKTRGGQGGAEPPLPAEQKPETTGRISPRQGKDFDSEAYERSRKGE